MATQDASSSLYIADAPANGSQTGRSRWSEWLPDSELLIDAAQLRLDDAESTPWRRSGSFASPIAGVRATSMRQGIGLIVVLALLAGLLPFLFNWVQAAQLGTVVPIAEALTGFNGLRGPFVEGVQPVLVGTAENVAGLNEFFPGWLAAFLSALGEWLNWPLQWLALWILYGLGTLLAALAFGARTTLQRFYAATSFAAVPLLLLALTPIPCIGALVTVVAVLWAGAVYSQAVQVATGLDWARTLASVFLPLAVAIVASLLLFGSLIGSLLRLAPL